MFSSINFSSLLPSGLGLAPATTPTQDKPPVVERVEDNDTDAEDNAERSEANKDSKSGKKKEKPATEVRPYYPTLLLLLVPRLFKSRGLSRSSISSLFSAIRSTFESSFTYLL